MQRKARVKKTENEKRRARRMVWQRVVSMLTCIVVFCTTYALILPAITKSGDALCGFTEHTHNEDCYAGAEGTVNTLACAVQLHSHSDGCYDADGVLICGLADYVLHSHDSGCYSGDGALVCQLPEITGHVHRDACYTVAESHTHEDGCYSIQLGELICQIPETTAVEATEAVETTEGTEATETTEITEATEAVEPHTHGDGCYQQLRGELICGLEETAAQELVLVCQMTERAAHTHADCWPGCGMLQLTAHSHTEACFQTTEAEPVLICEQEEHVHGLICYADPTADLETKEAWESVFRGMDLSGTNAENLLAVARTQVGYTESTENYIVENDVLIKGYSRYGQWAGQPYMDWNRVFVSFCLHYAGITEAQFPRAGSADGWVGVLAAKEMFAFAGSYTPQPGDLIFLKDEQAETLTLTYVGIVTAINAEGYVTAILGDYNDQVISETFAPGDRMIYGYGLLPQEEQTEDTATEPSEETTEPSTEETGATTEATEPSTEATEPATEETEPATEATEEAPLSAEITVDLTGITATAAEETTVNQLSGQGRMVMFAASNDAVATAAAYDEKYNLANYMNGEGDGISIQYKRQASDSSWTPLEGTLQETVGKEFVIRFTIEYTLPGGTLSTENNTLYYQLPVNEILEARSGSVRDNTGTAVGSYVIDKSGLVTITFFDDYAKQNAGGKAIQGSISFDSDAYGFDTDGDNIVDLTESDGDQLYLTLKDTVETDLTVEKTASNVNTAEGTVEYTIVVSSISGTTSEVTLNDTMTNGSVVEGTFTITSNQDGTVNVTAPSGGSKEFNLTLPQMAAGEKYVIKYTAKLNNVWAGQVNMTNAVTVNSDYGDDKILTNKDEITVPFDYTADPLTKGFNENSDGTLTWTITIKPSEVIGGLEGWTLSDVFNGEAYTGSATINFGSGDQTITLPYEFTQDYADVETITVTYTTSSDYGLGMNGAVNKAILTPPPESNLPPHEEEENYHEPGDYYVSYNPIHKTFMGVVDGDTGNDQLQWSLTIKSDKSTLDAGWYITDTLKGMQYFTDAQKTAIENALRNELNTLYGKVPSYTLVFSGEYAAKDGKTYPNSFTLTVNEALAESDTSVNVIYSSTVEYDDNATNGQTFTNVATLNDKVTTTGYHTRYPLLSKVDGNNNSTTGTFYDTSYLTSGILKWKVYISPTSDMDYALVVKEDIPDELTLNALQFNGQTFDFGDGTSAAVSVTVNGTAYQVTATQKTEESGNKYIEILLPQQVVEYYQNKLITLNVEMKLPSNFQLDDPVEGAQDVTRYYHKVIGNSVTIGKEGEDTELDSGEHEQTIYNPGGDTTGDQEDKTRILKQIGTVDDNVIPYTITVNADAEDLSGDSDWIEVTDVLTFTNYDVPDRGKYTVALDTSDVFITLYDADGNVVLEKTRLAALAENATPIYPGGFVYNQTFEWEWGTTEHVTSTIQFTIPDGYKAVLDYQYAVYGESTSGQIGLTNVATLKATDYQATSGTNGWFKITESEAQANLRSINIYKVDAHNSAIHLAGAYYELYKYVVDENGNGAYHFDQQIQSNGESELELKNLVANTAYYLVEIEAPDGYILDESRHYFLIKDDTLVDSETGTVKYTAPADFPATGYYSEGAILYITNDHYTDSITVRKEWRDTSGELLTSVPEGTQIEVQLYQVYSDYPLNFNYGSIGTAATIDLTVGDYSYMSNVTVNNNAPTDGFQIGDTVTITYKFTSDPLAVEPYDPPGLMKITATDNIHIPYTKSADGLTYTFRLRITEASTNLDGWVYPNNAGNVTVSIHVDTPYEEADATQTVTAYGEPITISADNNWRHTFYGLPAYYLADNGQVWGYYSYYVNEVSSNLAGYVPDYENAYSVGSAISSGTTVITNRPPEDTQITVQKRWNTDSGNPPTGVSSIQYELYQVVHTDPPGTSLHYIDVAFEVGQWQAANPNYLNETRQIEAGATVQVTMQHYGTPDIKLDSGTLQVTQTVITEGANSWDPDEILYTYTFTPTKDVNLYGAINANSYKAAQITILTSPDRTQKQGTLYGTYQLTADGNWQQTITNLPTVSTDANGLVVYYTYYVVEKDPMYDVTYELDGDRYAYCPDVDAGTVTIINTPVDEDKLTYLSVEKVWMNQNGKVWEAPTDSILFAIWQVGTSSTGETVSEEEYQRYELTAENGWKLEQIRLPAENADGSVTYTYYVKEVTEGYEASYTLYDENGSAVKTTSISGGSATITNTVYTYALPETGGPGTFLYTMSGLALCGWSLLKYNQKKGRKGDATP